MIVTHASRTAVARAKLFARLAYECRADQRVEFEAYLEASIVFARAALHRLQSKNRSHPNWHIWWEPLKANPSVEFIRRQRDWVLKEASPRVGQRCFAASVGQSAPSYEPSRADEFYFFESHAESAVATLSRHLQEVERLANEAEVLFG